MKKLGKKLNMCHTCYMAHPSLSFNNNYPSLHWQYLIHNFQTNQEMTKTYVWIINAATYRNIIRILPGQN